MNRLFRIASFTFLLQADQEIMIPEMFLKFQIDNGIPEYTYRIEYCNILPEIEGRRIASRDDLLVEEIEGKECRKIYFANSVNPLAITMEIDDRNSFIMVSHESAVLMKIDPFFVSLFSLERRMYQHTSFILHSAYTQYHEKAVLFTAPSGTGKSTQAELWRKYRDAEVVNGDRGLLSLSNDILTVHGWPVCGSSKICENRSAPVSAIVALGQAKVNTVSRLKPSQAFYVLYSQLTVNSWNREFVESAMEFIEQMIDKVPVYHLDCDISEDAVCCLEEVLIKDSLKS